MWQVILPRGEELVVNVGLWLVLVCLILYPFMFPSVCQELLVVEKTHIQNILCRNRLTEYYQLFSLSWIHHLNDSNLFILLVLLLILSLWYCFLLLNCQMTIQYTFTYCVSLSNIYICLEYLFLLWLNSIFKYLCNMSIYLHLWYLTNIYQCTLCFART